MNTYKTISSIIVLLSSTLLNFCHPDPSVAQTFPTFDVTVRNCQMEDTLGGDDNVIKFDIWILHTNPQASGPFELALNQYHLNFNPVIANGGTLSYMIVPGSTQYSNPNAAPRGPSVQGSFLGLVSNPILGAGNGPIVSAVFPGTRVVTMRLVTTAISFSPILWELAFRTAVPNPFTKIFAYIGTTATEISNNGTYSIEQLVCTEIVYPVEFVSFTSSVSRNNITLNWTTAKEINNAGFDIERKLASVTNWARVGNVAGNGNTNEIKNYTFSDRINTGKYNYRLKQLDYNGNFEYFNLSDEVEVGIPQNYSLSQNYPNPFNPTTKINYDIPFDGKISLILYDMMGREIKTLVNEIQTAGYYAVDFNGSGLASGAYFYRLLVSRSNPVIAGGDEKKFVDTKRMVIVR